MLDSKSQKFIRKLLSLWMSTTSTWVCALIRGLVGYMRSEKKFGLGLGMGVNSVDHEGKRKTRPRINTQGKSTPKIMSGHPKNRKLDYTNEEKFKLINVGNHSRKELIE